MQENQLTFSSALSILEQLAKISLQRGIISDFESAVAVNNALTFLKSSLPVETAKQETKESVVETAEKE